MASTGESSGTGRDNRRRKVLGIGWGALVLAAALFVPAWFVPLLPVDRAELTVTFTRGGGTVRSADGTSAELVRGTTLEAGDRLVVPAGGAASLTAADGHRLTLGDSTSLGVDGSRRTLVGGRIHTDLDVEGGEVRVSGEADPRTSLDIGLPNGVAGVRGTVFDVEVREAGAAVSVHEGRVGLTGTPGESVELTPGEAAVLTATGPVVRGVPAAPVVRRLPPGRSVVRAPGTFLHWSPVAGADAYLVELASDTAFLEVETRLRTETDSVELPILDIEEPLLVRVQAVADDGVRGTPSLPYPIRMAYRWSEGLRLRAEGDVSGSLPELEAAMERQVDNPDLLRDYGWSLYLLGRHGAAREVYERGRALAPEYDELLVELGRVYFWLGEYDLAQATYLEVMERRPDYADALWGLGDTYRVIGRRAEALDLVRRAVAIDPDHPYAGETLRELRGGG